MLNGYSRLVAIALIIMESLADFRKKTISLKSLVREMILRPIKNKSRTMKAFIHVNNRLDTT